jgi:hypothetical protein
MAALAAMMWLVCASAPADTACTYQMTTVNWDNLESPKSEPITVNADGTVAVDKKGK